MGRKPMRYEYEYDDYDDYDGYDHDDHDHDSNYDDIHDTTEHRAAQHACASRKANDARDTALLLARKDEEISSLTTHLHLVRTKLLDTLSQLDALKADHATALASSARERERLEERVRVMEEEARKGEADRLDMRDAVGMLVERVESTPDFSKWPRSQMHLSSPAANACLPESPGTTAKRSGKHAQPLSPLRPRPASQTLSQSPSQFQSLSQCLSQTQSQTYANQKGPTDSNRKNEHNRNRNCNCDSAQRDGDDQLAYATTLLSHFRAERDAAVLRAEEGERRVRELEVRLGRWEGMDVDVEQEADEGMREKEEEKGSFTQTHLRMRMRARAQTHTEASACNSAKYNTTSRTRTGASRFEDQNEDDDEFRPTSSFSAPPPPARAQPGGALRSPIRLTASSSASSNSKPSRSRSPFPSQPLFPSFPSPPSPASPSPFPSSSQSVLPSPSSPLTPPPAAALSSSPSSPSFISSSRTERHARIEKRKKMKKEKEEEDSVDGFGVGGFGVGVGGLLPLSREGGRRRERAQDEVVEDEDNHDPVVYEDEHDGEEDAASEGDRAGKSTAAGAGNGNGNVTVPAVPAVTVPAPALRALERQIMLLGEKIDAFAVERRRARANGANRTRTGTRTGTGTGTGTGVDERGQEEEEGHSADGSGAREAGGYMCASPRPRYRPPTPHHLPRAKPQLQPQPQPLQPQLQPQLQSPQLPSPPQQQSDPQPHPQQSNPEQEQDQDQERVEERTRPTSFGGFVYVYDHPHGTCEATLLAARKREVELAARVRVLEEALEEALERKEMPEEPSAAGPAPESASGAVQPTGEANQRVGGVDMGVQTHTQTPSPSSSVSLASSLSISSTSTHLLSVSTQAEKQAPSNSASASASAPMPTPTSLPPSAPFLPPVGDLLGLSSPESDENRFGVMSGEANVGNVVVTRRGDDGVGAGGGGVYAAREEVLDVDDGEISMELATPLMPVNVIADASVDGEGSEEEAEPSEEQEGVGQPEDGDSMHSTNPIEEDPCDEETQVQPGRAQKLGSLSKQDPPSPERARSTSPLSPPLLPCTPIRNVHSRDNLRTRPVSPKSTPSSSPSPSPLTRIQVPRPTIPFPASPESPASASSPTIAVGLLPALPPHLLHSRSRSHLSFPVPLPVPLTLPLPLFHPPRSPRSPSSAARSRSSNALRPRVHSDLGPGGGAGIGSALRRAHTDSEIGSMGPGGLHGGDAGMDGDAGEDVQAQQAHRFVLYRATSSFVAELRQAQANAGSGSGGSGGSGSRMHSPLRLASSGNK